MKRGILVFLLSFALLPSLAESAKAGLIVVPGNLASSNGDATNVFPFFVGTTFNPQIASHRYQQVYGASAFAGVTGPILITDISFRPGSFQGPETMNIRNIQINLSTTGGNPDGLSAQFANNVGADDTVVHSGSLTLSTAGSGGGVGSFDLTVHLTNPFLYDPGQGNLLFDVRNFTGGDNQIGFDAIRATGDPVSRAFTSTNGTVNDPSAFSTDTIGLVTQFTFQAGDVNTVPEPSSLVLLGIGTAVFAGYSRRRRKQFAAEAQS